MIYISVHLVLIYTLAFSNVLLVLALNLIVHKSSYCKCSLAWCQTTTFLLFTIWTHPLKMRKYMLRYASTDKNKKSHYNIHYISTYSSHSQKPYLYIKHSIINLQTMLSLEASIQSREVHTSLAYTDCISHWKYILHFKGKLFFIFVQIKSRQLYLGKKKYIQENKGAPPIFII